MRTTQSALTTGSTGDPRIDLGLLVWGRLGLGGLDKEESTANTEILLGVNMKLRTNLLTSLSSSAEKAWCRLFITFWKSTQPDIWQQVPENH